jgi:hypothetical protein
MFSEKLRLQDQSGIQRLEQVGAFLVIANKQLYETGKSRRFTLVNELEQYVHSVHGSQRAAVVYAQKRLM